MYWGIYMVKRQNGPEKKEKGNHAAENRTKPRNRKIKIYSVKMELNKLKEYVDKAQEGDDSDEN